MARQWVKRELKKDPLAAFAAASYNAVNKNRSAALSAAVAFAVVVGFAVMLYTAHEKNVKNAFADMIKAGSVTYSNPDMALGLCDKVLSQYSGTSKMGSMALYIKGNALYVKGDYKGARKTYETALKDSRSRFRPNILFSIAKSDESLEKWQDAMKDYSRFISQYDRHYLSPDAYLSMARILSASGNSKQASKYIEVIKGRYQNTKWAKYAEELQPGAAGGSKRVSKTGNNS